MSTEAMVVKRWLQAKLVSDGTLAALAPGSVHEGVAPAGTTTPYVVWTPVNMGSDIFGVGAIRVMTRFSYQVCGWMTGNDFAVLDPIALRIDQLLHNASGTASGGHVISSVRLDIVDPGVFVDTNGRTSRQAGGLYQIEAQQT